MTPSAVLEIAKQTEGKSDKDLFVFAIIFIFALLVCCLFVLARYLRDQIQERNAQTVKMIEALTTCTAMLDRVDQSNRRVELIMGKVYDKLNQT